jgi:putative phosphoesterase
MKIGIISDTHDQRLRTLAAVEMLKDEGAERLIHCGDLTHPEMVSACSSLPSYFVFGNNDSPYVDEIRSAIMDLPDSICLEWGEEIVLSEKRIAITHGHINREVQRLLRSEPDYLFSGHSHVAQDWQEGNTRWINPGALYRARMFSVALLNLDSNKLRTIEVPR